MPSFSKVVGNSRRNHCPCSRWILERLSHTRARCWHLLCLLPLMSFPSSCTGLRCTGHGIIQGLQWPSEHEAEPKSDILWCQGPQVPAAASMPIAESTAGWRIPRERQHVGIALCFKFQQKQSFRVLPQREWKLREKTPDQHYICLGSWKYFYEMSCIFTVFPPFHHVTHRTKASLNLHGIM